MNECKLVAENTFHNFGRKKIMIGFRGKCNQQRSYNTNMPNISSYFSCHFLQGCIIIKQLVHNIYAMT